MFKRQKTELGGKLAKSGIGKAIANLPPEIRGHAEKIFYFPFSTKIKRPEIEPVLRQELMEFLKEDLDRLRHQTHLTFSQWSV